MLVDIAYHDLLGRGHVQRVLGQLRPGNLRPGGLKTGGGQGHVGVFKNFPGVEFVAGGQEGKANVGAASLKVSCSATATKMRS